MADRRFPLCWPNGWPRTPPHRRKRSRYKVSEETAKQHLIDELQLLGARGVIVSTNVDLRRDGLPYANQRIHDPGVAVYWTRNGKEFVIACDCYVKIGENFRAIGLTVEALRAIERAGAGEILERSFTGFAALPPPSTMAPVPDWRDVLGLNGTVSRLDVERAYRELSKTHHPDAGGTSEQFVALTRAKEAALREVGHG